MLKSYLTISYFLIIIAFTSSFALQFSYASNNPTRNNVENSKAGIDSTQLRVLVVLMELQDDPHHPSHDVEHFETLFFGSSGLSIKQYYQNTSYGEVSLSGDVLGWYQSINNLSYYGAGNRIPPRMDAAPDELVFEARNRAINEGKNPVNYDLFVVIHSGDGQEYSGNSDDIWSHQWALYNFGLSNVEYSMNHEYVNYETPSHELGHALYFPDLYDFRYYEHEFAGPYAMMDSGDGHFAIWNKYYSHLSRYQSPQFLSDNHRLQISNYTNDTFETINPIAISEPEGIMWLEIGWDSTGYDNPTFGRGWTVSVRENLDFDRFIPKHGVVIARIQVGPRYGLTQVLESEYPPWEVVDAHPETAENKEDAAFSLADGDLGTFRSGEGWAVQLIEKYNNMSYRVRVTNESNIPIVSTITPNQSLSGTSEIFVTVHSSMNKSISSVEISFDNGQWQACTPNEEANLFSFSWDTTLEREGTHLIRTRAKDNSTIPYIGYSSFILVDIDNANGSILVVDDDLGRSSESYVLMALDELGLIGDCEIKQTSSFDTAEITAEEMMKYEKVIWVGNPEISPLANSHINYQEFLEIKQYLETPSETRPPRIVFMCSYNIFDFSNQPAGIIAEIAEFFRATSPQNFRAPVTMLNGYDFLSNLSPFTLGSSDTLRAARGSDGEIVSLLSGVVPILKDTEPEFPNYDTKGYYTDDGNYKIVNYLFQPEMVPSSILPQLLSSTLNYLDEPNNSTFTTTTTTGEPPPPIEIDPVILIFSIFTVAGIAIYFSIKRLTGRTKITDSYWLQKKNNE
ncbi:MAG: immune inhibitor A domain-containing protein [Candidatus Hodarchaeota archaeon]